MADQDIARTIIFDLVQLEKLGAELERRFRSDPQVQVLDVLADIDAEDHMLYLPQLTNLREGLVKRAAAGTLEPLDPALGNTVDAGDDMHRSLMATAMIADSDPGGSTPGSGGKVSSGGKISSGSKAPSGSGGSIDPTKSSAPDRIDQFRIIRELGAGAFGVVYLAEDESLQRKVAIKVPKVSDPARCASYINEARKAAAIDCKGIVPIFHVGTKENGIPFVVQKLIDGPSLRLLLTRYGSLPPAHAVTLMRDIAVALSSAHRLGIYHRDLKPDNVLIDGNGVPWIADFGLAISESEQAQRKGEIAGTLIYMSPEQIQGRADWLDGRSDLWALGIMLHELLLGKPPFSGKNRQSLMEQICHREPRPLQQSSPSLTALNEVFVKCCAKSPSDRYSSAEELAGDLTFLINEGLPTQPIDGSELRFEQPISQYPSDASRSSRLASGGTALTGGGTTRAAGATATHLSSVQASSAQGLAGSVSASGQASGSLTQTTAIPAKAEHWTRVLMIGIGVACLLGLGGQQWYASRHPAMTIAGPNADPELSTAADARTPSDTEMAPNVPVAPEVIRPDDNTSALTPSQANGSQELPLIVAADGSGSHRTIAAATAACEPNGYVQIKPGTYNESLKIVKPIKLLGMGKPNECVISSTSAPPLEVACGLGLVSVENLSLTGNGLQERKEFNAVEISNGKLRINNCLIRSSTHNGIKVFAGASLDASDCKFIESSSFAISTKNHIALTVTDCEFFQSGVQSVGGPVSVSLCTFNGREGVYVGQSGETQGLITGCNFMKCQIYGVVATDNGDVEIKKSTFDGCKFGVRVNGGNSVIRDCTFTACDSSSVDLTGGNLTIADKTIIQNSGNFGCSVVGGILKISDANFTDTKATAVIGKGKVDVRLENTIIRGCGNCGVNMMEGNLTLIGGTVEGCDEAAVSLSDLFAHATISKTTFLNNPGGAVVMSVGDVDCEDISVTGSEIALLARSMAESPSYVTLTRAAFENIKDVVADLEGEIHLTFRECTFAEIPDGKRVRKLDGAQVKVVQ